MSTLAKVLARRIGQAVLTVLLASLLVFLALQALPGNLATQVLGRDATPAAVAQLNASLNLNRPAWRRYLDWLGGAMHGDFGTSLISHQPVATEAGHYLRNTGLLALVVIVVGISGSLVLGVIAGMTRDRWPDLLISTLALIGMSVPEFTVATLLVLFFAIKLAWFPAVVTTGPTSSISDLSGAIWLPAAALTIVLAAYIIRMMRTSMIDVLAGEYVTLARIRGLSPARVLFRHALPNALLPTLNVIAINVAWLVGGVVVVESIFNYPGIGTLMMQAVRNRDLPVLQFIAVLGAVTFVTCNLIADLVSTWLNPRLRTPGRAG
jgi:peptide/nickel transport system permease protein